MNCTVYPQTHFDYSKVIGSRHRSYSCKYLECNCITLLALSHNKNIEGTNRTELSVPFSGNNNSQDDINEISQNKQENNQTV